MVKRIPKFLCERFFATGLVFFVTTFKGKNDRRLHFLITI